MGSPGIDSFAYAGHRLTYETHGEGDRVVVLLHGLLLDANVNRRLARSIAAQGYRVVLLDLLGHGGSDRPPHASLHRMDSYAAQVVALLDAIGVEKAAVGGVSLGANVALQAAVAAPDRLWALVVEMPVLERATPAAAMVFVPALLALRVSGPGLRPLTSLVGRLPRPGIDLVDGLLNALSLDPPAAAAVLHGMLLGPIAPTVDERAAIAVPALIIGHRADLMHPFADAEHLARQLPDAQLLAARSMAELRAMPARLTAHIIKFLDAVWARPARMSSG
ncbi:MAG: alpha/beta fold hydrolase [Actinomycetes bacterium]